MTDFEVLKAHWMQDPEFKAEYDALEDEFALAAQLIQARSARCLTQAQEASYTAWLNAKVQASLNDPRPSVPHGQVMAKARALLACL